jgi:hypothetical protein
LTGKVYQGIQDSLKHRHCWNISLRQKTFIGGEGSGGERSPEKITGEDMENEYIRVMYQTLNRDDYQEVDQKVTDTYSEPHH